MVWLVGEIHDDEILSASLIRFLHCSSVELLEAISK